MSDSDSLPVPEEQILGVNTYPGVLFTEETETPVNVLSGETPEHSQASVADAEYFAAQLSRDKDKPYVAKSASVEAQIETQSKPYTACVFHHFSLVGGMEMHKAFSAAWEADAYEVDVHPDYQTGTLTITVSRV